MAIGALGGGCIRYDEGTVEIHKRIRDSEVRQIVIGKTTRSEVFQLLGTPFSIFEGPVQLAETRSMSFYSHSENRPFTSIDPWHYAMLYRFSRDSYTHSVVLIFGQTNVQIKTDELLLLINKETNVVHDVAYRNETRSKGPGVPGDGDDDAS
jgi:hypothetical protein